MKVLENGVAVLSLPPVSVGTGTTTLSTAWGTRFLEDHPHTAGLISLQAVLLDASGVQAGHDLYALWFQGSLG
jgi:hypothetical protein